ncbi:MAG TPA: carboxypeptidase-like regulatory domain-containing protein, partial [Terriglobia bacterium]|nr:carboxypeptidase-like regulatory domain-containing protein [Terriglobia bacterium]
MKRLPGFLYVLVFILALGGTAAAQSGNATVSGTVTDSSSALIPGVSIKATNTQTSVLSATVSNEAGVYSFPSLQPGVYRVSAELPGFQTHTFTNVQLGNAQQVRLNFVLQVATVAQSVEVSVAVDTLLATSSSSVGTVLNENSVRELPLLGRDALELVNIMAGFREPVDPSNSNARTGPNGGFVAGISVAAVNTTRDGISVNDGRYNLGVFSATHINPDLVGELRIILAPVDAENGRGSGQVQIMTRSGTNRYNGAAVWNIQNTALNANTWNNNRTGAVPNWFNRHQLSVNYGGPIIRNKTFFFVLYDGQRMWSREVVRATVLTDAARNGNFRFFGNVVNGNADAIPSSGANPVAPVVDHLGNPLSVAQIQASITAAGSSNTVTPMQTISVFNRDPNRPGFDPTGYIQRITATMPQPNDFTGGDGLNTAIFRWNRRGDSLICSSICQQGLEDDVNRNQINVKVDHNFNTNHKFSVNYTYERFTATGQRGAYPGKEDEWYSQTTRKPQVITSSFVSTLTPTIVNDVRFGMRRAWSRSPYPYDEESTKDEVLAFLPNVNSYPVLFNTMPINVANNILNPGNNTNANTSTLWTLADSLSWTKGKHAFKGGIEGRW